MTKATTGPGTTNDPNQANKTGLPEKTPETPDVTPPEANDGATTDRPDDPTTGPGTTSDPNQANRT
ncbi:hypothetical protein ILP92_03565 [Maribius pontilimi]|uniref:Uncharacterized protein n=1 Tax=Palleronia pontilimi TaxID=1964209 RepID=A0A934IA18_9RHOB|nr:hypothetical protein [Palleronia pontilimi]MBJ3761826.1 hypothetical protein [Palleronia pontilimi]